MILFEKPPAKRPSLFGRGPAMIRVRLAQAAPSPALQSSGDPVADLAVNGAILQAQVSQPGAYAQSISAPAAPQTFTAMVDSGASISCITVQAAQALGLPQVSSTQLGGVGGMTESPIYAARITLPQFGVTVDPVQIAGVSNPLPGTDMLIGRDILKTLNFNYHGGQGAFTITQEAAAPAGTAPLPGTPAPVTQSLPAGQAAPAAAAPAALPQPPPETTILGMSPITAGLVGTGIVAAGVGAFFYFKS